MTQQPIVLASNSRSLKDTWIRSTCLSW